ncbi:hypothetical protein [Falsibacillus pallidus]|uniref:Uncharacterized protein n=1 Tax=Falsibacillus pallidus TaxID=493781 RepID=A0A370G5V9_9BACI|nr:hypothetical protein [Falsibacillus pallidus]RDI39155.1 hypothetical protein DFR59_11562 [Falsibacillus pallidus]
MKALLLTILGATTAWFVLGFILKDFGTQSLFSMVIGIIIGFNVGKKESR